jgi:4-hydroxythreonine-4-phosphate dehydrogenase
MSKNIIVGITIGDVNGIGPEIILKSLIHPQIYTDNTIVIYGSSKVLTFYKKTTKIQDMHFHSVSSVDEIKNRKINIVELAENEIELTVGKTNNSAGELALKALETATKDIASGKIDVLVTAPIHKESMQNSGFKFPGHTEFLADLSGGATPLMMMVSEKLKIALATIHEPLAEVANKINRELIEDKIEILINTLKRDFAIKRPKVAVLGLNPHAGEKGKIGTEEQEIINPLLQNYRKNNQLIYGPYPADGFFGGGQFVNFDAVFAMYHDQGLIPFKTIAQDYGVNFTAGLQIVRTSPDHGTGYDIAGKGIANPSSMINAIWQAIDIYKTRQQEKELNTNVLKTQSSPKN